MRIFIYSDLNLISLKTLIAKNLNNDVVVFFKQINALIWDESIIDIKKNKTTQRDLVIFWFSRSALLKNIEIMKRKDYSEDQKIIEDIYKNALKNIKELNSLGLEILFINPDNRFITDKDILLSKTLIHTSRFWEFNSNKILENNGIKVIYESDFKNVSHYSNRLWYLSKNPFSLDYLKIISIHILNQIKFILNPIKVLAFDLDDTIWGGVLGEDGNNGIRLGGHDPKGELFKDIQRVILNIKSRGIIIGALSKNNLDEVKKVFQLNGEMILSESDLDFLLCNWEEKHENIIKVAKKLSISLENFAFLDNSYVEREKMINSCPTVWTIPLPNDEFEWASYLSNLFNFNNFKTDEDTLRKKHYKLENLREKELNKFLPNNKIEMNKNNIKNILGLRVKDQEFDLMRIHQLFMRTNQFNLSSRRLTKEQINNLNLNPRTILKSFRVEDNFGDYGMCAVFVAEFLENILNINDFMISCRSLGRGVEDYIFDEIISIAKKRNLKLVKFNYVDTKRNEPIKKFLLEKEVSITDQIYLV